MELDDVIRKQLVSEGYDVRKTIDDFEDEEFDFISMFHVIEHLEDPYIILEQLKSKLSPSGVLMIETPNADEALLSLYDCEEIKNFTYWSAHVQLYTFRTLEMVVKKAGYHINWNRQLQRYPISNHLYWLRYGKPGGQSVWGHIDSSILNDEYARVLERLGKCETLLLCASK